MPFTIADRLAKVKPSATLAVSNKADELQSKGINIINLGIGEPDFDTPDHIKQAAIEAIKAGFTKYTPVDGAKELKQAILNKFIKDNKLLYDLKQIIVGAGAKQVIYNCLQALINPEDEVIIPAPYWVSYPDMVNLSAGKPVFISTTAASRYKITAKQLADAITPKTRMIILNSPSNPSGIAYSIKELKALGEVLLKYPQVIILSDDIYEHNLWTREPFANIAMACPELVNRTVLVNGASKTYAMTGWRIGYAAGPLEIINAMKTVQSQSTSNPNSIAQKAAVAALNGDQSCVQQMTQAYKKRHDYLVKELNSLPGFHCLAGDGTFYAFADVSKAQANLGLKDDIAFAEFLLNKAHVAVVPGTPFGCSNHVRFSFAASNEKLQAAVAQMKAALKENAT